MSALQFTFDVDKLAQVLAYLSNHGVRDLTKLKAAKLLYFADKAHLLRYGRPIIGDRYVCWNLGPVPYRTYTALNTVLQPNEVEELETQHLADVIMVSVPSEQYPAFVAKRTEQEYDHLSPSEMEVLEEIVLAYGAVPARRLVDLSHDEPAWQQAREACDGGSGDMPYELFFDERDPSQAAALAMAREEQENDRLLHALVAHAR